MANICRLAGVKEGQIGTNGHVINGRQVQARMTTPEAPQLHTLLADMLREGVDCVAMEVSSVGLEEARVAHRVLGGRLSQSLRTISIIMAQWTSTGQRRLGCSWMVCG